MRLILTLGLMIVASTAGADIDPCVTSEKLDLSAAKHLPASFEFRSAVNAFALRGQISRLKSAECWRQSRAPGTRFQESGFAVVYLPPVATDSGLCRSATVGFLYADRQWKSAKTSYFAVALPPDGDCDSVKAGDLIDVFTLIEDYELQSLLRAEPQLRARRGIVSRDFRSIELRSIDDRTYYILGYGDDSCNVLEVHVSGDSHGGYHDVGAWQVVC